MNTDKQSFMDISQDLPTDYVNDVIENAPWERDFHDEELHWYSPFILWAEQELVSYQPDYDSGFASFVAIGSNGGMETYLLKSSDGSIWVADLIGGTSSLERVADSYSHLLKQLKESNVL